MSEERYDVSFKNNSTDIHQIRSLGDDHGKDGYIKKGSFFSRTVTVQHNGKSYTFNKGSAIDFLNEQMTPKDSKNKILDKTWLIGSSDADVRKVFDAYINKTTTEQAFQNAIKDNEPFEAHMMLLDNSNLDFKSVSGGLQVGGNKGLDKKDYISQIKLKILDPNLSEETKKEYKYLMLALIEKGASLPLGENAHYVDKSKIDNFPDGRHPGNSETLLTPSFYKEILLPVIEEFPDTYKKAGDKLEMVFSPILKEGKRDFHPEVFPNEKKITAEPPVGLPPPKAQPVVKASSTEKVVGPTVETLRKKENPESVRKTLLEEEKKFQTALQSNYDPVEALNILANMDSILKLNPELDLKNFKGGLLGGGGYEGNSVEKHVFISTIVTRVTRSNLPPETKDNYLKLMAVLMDKGVPINVGQGDVYKMMTTIRHEILETNPTLEFYNRELKPFFDKSPPDSYTVAKQRAIDILVMPEILKKAEKEFQEAIIDQNDPLKALEILRATPDLDLKSVSGGVQLSLYTGPDRKNYVSQIKLKILDPQLPLDTRDNYKKLLLVLIEKGVDLPLGLNSRYAPDSQKAELVAGRYGETAETLLTPSFYKQVLLPFIKASPAEYKAAQERIERTFFQILKNETLDSHPEVF